jgi:hypothetical protein
LLASNFYPLELREDYNKPCQICSTIPHCTSFGRLIDPDWIIILFFIYLDAFRVEKIGGINLQGHFNKSQFGKLGFETLQSHFEEPNGMFWGQNLHRFSMDPLTLIYTKIPFHWCKNHVNQSLYAKNMPPTS